MTDKSFKIENTEVLSPDEIVSLLSQNFAFYEPTPKQIEFHKAGLQAKERLFLGGNRTGKTYAVCVEMAMHLTGIYPDDWAGYRYSRPISAISASISLKDTRDILQAKLFNGEIDGSIPPIIHPDFVIEKTHTSIAGAWDTVSIRHISGGVSQLKFKAFQQGESSFQGVKADVIHLDELPDYKVYLEALMRTTSFGDEKTFIMVTMWPEKGRDETIEHFMDNAPAGEVRNSRFYVMASWADNPYLRPEVIEQLRRSVPAWQIEAREHGVPLLGHGKVFTMREGDIKVDPFEIPKHWAQIYGLDLSSSSGGTWGMVLLAYDRDGKTIYAVKDYERSDLTPMEHGYNIKQIVPEWCMGMNDPAGAGENMHTKEKTIDFLKNTCQLNLITAYKANGVKEATIDEIYTLCRSNNFKIMYRPQKKLYDGTIEPAEGCVNLIREWRQYARDEKGNIIKRFDHTLDALFYALNGWTRGNARTQGQAHSEFLDSLHLGNVRGLGVM